MTHAALQEVRKENLRRLILDKFEGNRAAMARTSGIHPNQINLMLSENDAFRRPITDNIVERLVANLNLPEGYFDVDGRGVRAGPAVLIPARDVEESVSSLFSNCRMWRSISLAPEWFSRANLLPGDLSFLTLVDVACDDMAPELSPGDTVILGPAKEITRDGIYVLSGKAGAVLRRVQRRLDGWSVSTPNKTHDPQNVSTLKGIKPIARVVTKLSQP